MVSGLHRSPRTGKWPLKSAHHTEFGASYLRRSSAYGELRRRRFGIPTRPCFLRIPPTVLATGSSSSGRFRANTTSAGPPAHVPPTFSKQRLDHLDVHRVWMSMRGARPIYEIGDTAILVPTEPLVARLGADAVSLTQLLE